VKCQDNAQILALQSLKDGIFGKFNTTVNLLTRHIANLKLLKASCWQNVPLFWQDLQL
jgi:hypothetical protein